MLRAAGAPEPALSDSDRFQVAVLANDEAEARRTLATSPEAASQAGALVVAATRGRLDALDSAWRSDSPSMPGIIAG